MSTPSELSIAAAVPKLELGASASRAARSSSGLTSHTTVAPVVALRSSPQQVCRANTSTAASCKQFVQTHAPSLLDASAADDQGGSFAFVSPRRVARAQSARRGTPVPKQLQFSTVGRSGQPYPNPSHAATLSSTDNSVLNPSVVTRTTSPGMELTIVHIHVVTLLLTLVCVWASYDAAPPQGLLSLTFCEKAGPRTWRVATLPRVRSSRPRCMA